MGYVGEGDGVTERAVKSVRINDEVLVEGMVRGRVGEGRWRGGRWENELLTRSWRLEWRWGGGGWWVR